MKFAFEPYAHAPGPCPKCGPGGGLHWHYCDTEYCGLYESTGPLFHDRDEAVEHIHLRCKRCGHVRYMQCKDAGERP